MNTIKKAYRYGKYAFTITIVEKPDRVEMTPSCRPFLDHNDKKARRAYEKWMLPILEKYDSDPRPTVMFNPLHGETVTIIGDGKSAFGIYQRDLSGN